MVSELEQNFQQASEDVRNINQTPSQETLLILYSLYKQSIKGDATGKTPYLKGPVAVAKHSVATPGNAHGISHLNSHWIPLGDFQWEFPWVSPWDLPWDIRWEMLWDIP